MIFGLIIHLILKDCIFINSDGKIISDILFDNTYCSSKKGFARVKLNGKYNVINTEGRLLNDTWIIGC